MPWTIAHAAAVLPLRRLHPALPFTGLVIGSMSCDFGYYIGRFEEARFAHTLPGLLLVCLPTGLVVALLLRWLSGPLSQLLPQPHRAAVQSLLPAQPLRTARAWAGLALAILIGAATHSIWDGLTHHDGFFVQWLPLLRAPLFESGPRAFYVYNTLQHASTVLGALVLVLAYRRWLKRRAPHVDSSDDGRQDDGRDGQRRWLLVGCLVLAVALAWPWAASLVGVRPGALRSSMVLVHTVILSTSLFAVFTVTAALAWRWRRGPPG